MQMTTFITPKMSKHWWFNLTTDQILANDKWQNQQKLSFHKSKISKTNDGISIKLLIYQNAVAWVFSAK